MLMERYGEALADLDRAIELDPGHAWAIANRGYTYRRMERYEGALADLSRAIELDPGPCLGHRQPRRDLRERSPTGSGRQASEPRTASNAAQASTLRATHGTPS